MALGSTKGYFVDIDNHIAVFIMSTSIDIIDEGGGRERLGG